MPVVKATYDGRVFVPSDPVEVPEGTQVEVLVPPREPTEEEIKRHDATARTGTSELTWPPGKLSPDQQAAWEELMRQIQSSEPPFGSVEEYLRFTRKYP